jgi:regulator of replication initiation timing
MISKKINNNYRILFNGEHLPEEISQKELDDYLNDLYDTTIKLYEKLSLKQDNDIKSKVFDIILENAGLNTGVSNLYYRLQDLLYEIKEMQQNLKENDYDIKSYKESETILDIGFAETDLNNGIYSKLILEKENGRIQVFEEVFMLNNKFIHRLCNIEWEITDFGKKTKNITYDNLSVNDNLYRILKNSQHFMKNLS